jgi:hypothetical protein
MLRALISHVGEEADGPERDDERHGAPLHQAAPRDHPGVGVHLTSLRTLASGLWRLDLPFGHGLECGGKRMGFPVTARKG